MTNFNTCHSFSDPSFARYLTLKRALGRRYSVEEHVLRSIDWFLTQSKLARLTASSFTRWCQTLQHLTPTVRRNRMRIVRNHCLYRRRREPNCYVPTLDMLPAPHQSARPYIFSKEEIAQLIVAAQQLEPTNGSPLRPEVYSLAIVLLYTTGLRRGELVRLTLRDYDARQRTLFVSRTKFYKSRYLPLSPDGVCEVERYLKARRARRLPMSPESSFMWNRCSANRKFSGAGIGQGIRMLLRTTGIRKPDGKLPRTHDFRHAFAVHALLRWYRSGANVQAKLPFLSTYMGHASITSTEYYLHFIEPLARSACARFSKLCGALVNTHPKERITR